MLARSGGVSTGEGGSVMWDPGTAVAAVAVVSAGAFVLPPVARFVGGFCAIIGFFGMTKGSTWAPMTLSVSVGTVCRARATPPK